MTGSERTSRPIPLDSVAIAHHFRRTYGVDLPAATIRKWGQRGKVAKVERPPADGRPPTYDLLDVMRHAREIGLIPGE